MSFRIFAFAVVLALSGAAAFAQSPPAAPPPVSAFSALPQAGLAAISADGQTIALTAARDDGEQDIRIIDLRDRSQKVLLVGPIKVRRLQFEEGGQLLITASRTLGGYAEKSEVFRTFALRLSDGRVRTLLGQDGRSSRAAITGAYMVSPLDGAPDAILMSTYDWANSNDAEPVLMLFRSDLAKDRTIKVAQGNLRTREWAVDRAGAPVARVDFDFNARETTLFLLNGAAARPAVVEKGRGMPSISLVGLSQDGRIIFQRNARSAFPAYEGLDPATGEVAEIIKPDGIELEGAVTDPWTGLVVGVHYGGLQPGVQWIDPDLQSVEREIAAALNAPVHLGDWSRDRTRFLAHVERADIPPIRYLYDRSKRSLQVLATAMPALRGVPMGQMRHDTFLARDRLPIPAYVTFPPGVSEAKTLPTVVLPHGGPESRDDPEVFDWWAQFLASRGYVVVQPQFRGSTGFGRDFALMGRGEWGLKMQDDVTDAVGWAISKGWTDPARVCVVGASYGGYAALAGISMTPDVFRCAISVAGVSDLERMMNELERDARSDVTGNMAIAFNYWARQIGAVDQAELRDASPIRHVDAIKAPVLLIHGRDDTVVSITQSRVMADAMRKAGKRVQVVELDGEDHWLSRARTRAEMLGAIEAFLATQLSPGTPAR